MSGNAVHLAAGLELPGPADEAELVNAALERRALPAPKARIVAVVLLAAVVGEEDHDRVVSDLEIIELGQQAAHVVINVLDHAVDAGQIIRVVVGRHGMPSLRECRAAEVLVPVMSAILVGHLMRCVRAVECQVDKERLIAFLLDESNCRVGKDVADVAGGFHPLAIVAKRGVEVGAALVRRIWRVARLRQAATVENQRFLKAPVHGTHRIIVAQVPLAEDARAIASGGQHFRERRLIGVHERAAEKGVGDARAVVVAPGHQAGSRGRANRHNVKVHQRHALRGQAIDTRCMDDRVAGYTEFAETLVIREHDDNVGLRRRLCRRQR